ncbi:MAG TPA: FAD-binding oxidoreductase, partial [Rhodothermales bacterium]|nr:FAD-binding oxidoreductase [Rhodothermales bacterium]
MKPRRWRRWLLLLVAAVLAYVVGRPLLYLAWTAAHDRATIQPAPEGYADDVSRLNATRVLEVWAVPADAAEAERQLIALLQRAREQGLPVSIAGARHSMGGHTIAPDGIVINMLPFRGMTLSADGRVLTVQSGALWAEVIPFLNARGRSVGVMQSDNGFSVGGSLSTNVHGWQSRRPPIASTVRSFRLLTPEGEVVRCSRTEHADLFSLVLGGYGLFGIILDAELWTVPNEWYATERYVFPAE